MSNQTKNLDNSKQHATTATYIKVAIILTIITAVEVAYPYLTHDIIFLHPFYVPILSVLSLAKFILVVGFYMHLRYDSRALNVIFISSLIIAGAVGTAMMLLYGIV